MIVNNTCVMLYMYFKGKNVKELIGDICYKKHFNNSLQTKLPSV